jgi:hypothetical protein
MELEGVMNAQITSRYVDAKFNVIYKLIYKLLGYF